MLVGDCPWKRDGDSARREFTHMKTAKKTMLKQSPIAAVHTTIISAFV